MPLEAGTTFVYKGKSEGAPARQEFVVTDRTKTILGVKARIIRDTNWEGGHLVEHTEDWFAQDNEGNVWYPGEFATQYEDGEVVGQDEFGLVRLQPTVKNGQALIRCALPVEPLEVDLSAVRLTAILSMV